SGIDNVKRAIDSNTNLQKWISPKGATYSWEAVSEKLLKRQKAPQASDGKTGEQIKKEIDDAVANSLATQLKVNDAFKKEFEATGDDKHKKRKLLRKVLLEGAGLKSGELYVRDTKGDSAAAWK